MSENPTRLDDWAERLEAVIADAIGQPFAYGQNDCYLFVGKAAEALTGRDFTSPFVGAYDDLISGLRRLRAVSGAKSFEAHADTLFERVDPAFAWRGDWALATLPTEPDGKERPCMLLVDGAQLLGSTGVRVPRELAQICWRVV
jgi:hypothetical protein